MFDETNVYDLARKFKADALLAVFIERDFLEFYLRERFEIVRIYDSIGGNRLHRYLRSLKPITEPEIYEAMYRNLGAIEQTLNREI